MIVEYVIFAKHFLLMFQKAELEVERVINGNLDGVNKVEDTQVCHFFKLFTSDSMWIQFLDVLLLFNIDVEWSKRGSWSTWPICGFHSCWSQWRLGSHTPWEGSHCYKQPHWVLSCHQQTRRSWHPGEGLSFHQFGSSWLCYFGLYLMI